MGGRQAEVDGTTDFDVEEVEYEGLWCVDDPSWPCEDMSTHMCQDDLLGPQITLHCCQLCDDPYKNHEQVDATIALIFVIFCGVYVFYILYSWYFKIDSEVGNDCAEEEERENKLFRQIRRSGRKWLEKNDWLDKDVDRMGLPENPGLISETQKPYGAWSANRFFCPCGYESKMEWFKRVGSFAYMWFRFVTVMNFVWSQWINRPT